MYKSQFQKIDPYDWFCGPGSQFIKESIKIQNFWTVVVLNIYI